MRERIRLQQEYGDLVRAGKQKEAHELMDKIRGRVKPNIIAEVKPSEAKTIEHADDSKKPEIEQSTEITLGSLIKIKGIGKKTIKDIKVMFNNIDSLKEGLKQNKVALRDDIVEKLKEVLL